MTEKSRFQTILAELWDRYRYEPDAIWLRQKTWDEWQPLNGDDRILNETTGEWIEVFKYDSDWRAYDLMHPGRLLIDPSQLPGPCVVYLND